MTTTITQAEAERVVEDYVRQAAQALSADLRLEVIGSSTAPCTDPSDNGPQGRVFASNRYWIRGLPRERNEQSVQAFLQWSQQQGFAIQADEWAKTKVITLEKETDGFRMAIQESSVGDLSIGASSPCVWPNGTPEPQAR